MMNEKRKLSTHPPEADSSLSTQHCPPEADGHKALGYNIIQST